MDGVTPSNVFCQVSDLTVQQRVQQNSCTSAVRFDESTYEPYLPFPASFPIKGLRLTPARTTDAPKFVEILNHPLVYPNLYGPPYPLPLKNAEGWVRGSQVAANEVFAAWAADNMAPTALNPFNTIRHIEGGSDGTDVFVGEMALGKSQDNTFDSGVCLHPSYHRKGIASTAIQVLFNHWVIPNMTCNEVIAESFKSNPGSRLVYQKAGFIVDEKRSGKIMVQPESKRLEGSNGEEEEIVVVWHRSVK